MSGNPIKLGPFVGGLNNKSRTGEIKANELSEMINFEVTTDDSITSRPPYEIVRGSIKASTIKGRWKVLCIFRRTPSEWYLIVSEPAGTDTVKVNAYLNGDITSIPTLVEAEHSASEEIADACQFADEVFFIRDVGSASGCFKWSPSTGGYTSLPSMPRGTVIVSWKTRLWIAGRTDPSGSGARLRFSNISPTGAQPDVWNVDDFIDVAYGEGGHITSILPVMGNLIIFKTDGTWRFSYPSRVKDGSVDPLSTSIGAASRYSAIELENIIYVYDQGTLYELVNNQFTPINGTVEFIEDLESVSPNVDTVELSAVNRRIIVHYGNATYALSLRTKAWSQWRSAVGVPSRFVELPANSVVSSSPVYISATRNLNIKNDILYSGLTAGGKNGTAHVEDNLLYIPQGETVLVGSSEYTDDILPQTFNIPVSASHEIVLSLRYEDAASAIENPSVNGSFLLPDGTYTTVGPTTTTTVALGVDFTFKVATILTGDQSPIAVRFRITTVVSEANPYDKVINKLEVRRAASLASGILVKFKDSYEESASAKELIDCRAVTKAMDFNSPQSWKRLYWWGLDIKTFFGTTASAVPTSRTAKPLWREIDKYTNADLSKGTASNPLSWLAKVSEAFNQHGPATDVSEDGRFFKKLAKALRFQRISFEYETRTYGTIETGPAKMFTITPIVRDKHSVVDTNT